MEEDIDRGSVELTKRSCIPQSSGFWASRPTAGPPRCQIWRRRRSRAAAHYPAWARCPAAGSPEYAYLRRERETWTRSGSWAAHNAFTVESVCACVDQSSFTTSGSATRFQSWYEQWVFYSIDWSIWVPTQVPLNLQPFKLANITHRDKCTILLLYSFDQLIQLPVEAITLFAV